MRDDLTYPHYLLIALVGTLVLGVAVAGTTSGTAFGGYNPSWDGTATLRGIAGDGGGQSTIVTDVSEYTTVEPNETVAVILSPDRPYTSSETTTVSEFLSAGGTVVVADDIGPHTNPLLADLNSSTRVNGTVVRDEQSFSQSPALPVAPNVSDHRFTTGMEQLTLNYPSYLEIDRSDSSDVGDTQVLVSTSGFAYVDRNGDETLNDNEELRERPIVAVESVGEGTLVVVADPSVFINSMLEQSGNQQFARNLFAPYDTVLLDYSHQTAVPPVIAVQLSLQRTPLLAGLVGILLAVLVGAAGTRQWSARLPIFDVSDRTASDGVTPDPQALRAYLHSQYPDWDEQRLERVMEAVLLRDTSDTSDE